MTTLPGDHQARLRPKAITFDFYGTLMNSKEWDLEAFALIAKWNTCREDNPAELYDRWLRRVQDAYSGPYKTYRRICEEALARTFEDLGCAGRAADIEYFFDGFPRIRAWPDTEPVLQELAEKYPLGIVTNCDEDLFRNTPRPDVPFRYICVAEAARGYKPDGTLFRYTLREIGISAQDLLHAGQSQRTDLIGGKPLGITCAWINRHGLTRHDDVPAPDYEFPDLRGLLDVIT